MIIVHALRTARTIAHVRVTQHDYRKHPARTWLLWEGDVKVKHGLSGRQAAAVVAEAMCAALEASEDLPVGEPAYVQLELPLGIQGRGLSAE